MRSDEVLDSTFVACVGKAQRNVKGRPAALCSLKGASGTSVQERSSNLHKRYTRLSGWDAAAKDLPIEFRDCWQRLPRVQQHPQEREGEAAAWKNESAHAH